MDEMILEPWIPPAHPDLARLALEAADEDGSGGQGPWPEILKGGIGFGGLPPFLPWHGFVRGRHHLVLVQARELGGLVPGARTRPLPEGWIEALDLEALARPLARHPAFPGGAAVHLVAIAGRGRARVRSWGPRGEGVVAAVLARLSGIEVWSLD